MTEEQKKKGLLLRLNDDKFHDLRTRVREYANTLGKTAGEIFYKCFFNTIDTTCHYEDDGSVFVVTGDIPAMWLRDSAAQVMQYLFFADDEEVRALIKGVIKKQIVKACQSGEDPALDPNCGIITGRMNTFTLNLENAYFIGDGTLFGNENSAANKRAEMHNGKTETWYATETAFKADKTANKLNFSGFSHYWDLTVDLPNFATD